MRTSAPLILTPGDPAGIGPEIALKAAIRHPGRFVVMGDEAHLSDLCVKFNFNLKFENWNIGQDLDPSTVALYPISWKNTPVAGQPDPSNSQLVISAIETAVKFAKNNDVSAVVTNPIAKSVLYAAGFSHPGHTEYLAALDNTDNTPIMMLANQFLRAVPLTIHQSLTSVPDTISKELIIERLIDIHHALKLDFGIEAPHIAVCGLNPHAGEDGHLGQEDKLVIAPALETLKAKGINVSGPYPADTLFTPEARAQYDVAIGMYHDQALIPVKTLDFHNSVNVTLNLSFIRTSPDHGTAFDIAGTGQAKPDSLIAAITMAAKMAENRQHAS